METKWNLEAIDEESDGWRVFENSPNSSENNQDTVAFVHLLDNLEQSESNASLISTAPELLAKCKEILGFLDKNSNTYKDLENLILKAEGKDYMNDELNYFRNYQEVVPKIVISFDLIANTCLYEKNASISELFFFEPFSDDLGIIGMNVSNNNSSIDEMDMIYPINELISEEVYYDFVKTLDKQYSNLENFMKNYESVNNLSFRDFLTNVFDGFSKKYLKEITLKEYLDIYPLIKDNEEFYTNSNFLPKFLESAPHTLHTDIKITYNNQTVDGVLFYIEKENKFFLFNKKQKSINFFMIPNEDYSKSTTKVSFLDLINR